MYPRIDIRKWLSEQPKDVFNLFWDSIKQDARFEWRDSGIELDTFYIYRELDSYCIVSFTRMVSPTHILPFDIIKLVSISTPPEHRRKGIADRCMKTIQLKLDRANEQLERKGVILLFPVPFMNCWTDTTDFTRDTSMIGYADHSGHLGEFNEAYHAVSWKGLRNWYAKLGWYETNASWAIQGMSDISRKIGRLPMIYPQTKNLYEETSAQESPNKPR